MITCVRHAQGGAGPRGLDLGDGGQVLEVAVGGDVVFVSEGGKGAPGVPGPAVRGQDTQDSGVADRARRVPPGTGRAHLGLGTSGTGVEGDLEMARVGVPEPGGAVDDALRGADEQVEEFVRGVAAEQRYAVAACDAHGHQGFAGAFQVRQRQSGQPACRDVQFDGSRLRLRSPVGQEVQVVGVPGVFDDNGRGRMHGAASVAGADGCFLWRGGVAGRERPAVRRSHVRALRPGDK